MQTLFFHSWEAILPVTVVNAESRDRFKKKEGVNEPVCSPHFTSLASRPNGLNDYAWPLLCVSDSLAPELVACGVSSTEMLFRPYMSIDG